MIKIPTLLLDKSIAEKNISKMMTLCKEWNMDFRPHFKTHQSSEIAEWHRVQGVKKCTVSSLSMAQYFANNAWTDITIAIPVNILEIDEIIELSEKVKLNLLVDHIETCEVLNRKMANSVSVFIEIDTGYGRSGVHYLQKGRIDELLLIIHHSSKLHFAGFLSHTGNSYSVDNMEEGLRLFEQSRLRMTQLKKSYSPYYPDIIISMGDTPSSAYAKDFTGIDEWRPGNYIFYDMMQYAQGVCSQAEIAMVLTCPLIGIYPERKEFVVYGGGVHLSKESMIYNGMKIFGWVKSKKEDGQDNKLSGFPLLSLSQEHGIVSASEEYLAQLKIGDLIEIIPVHSCMTADLHPAYYTKNGHLIEKYRSNSL